MEGDHASAKFEASILPSNKFPSEKNDHPRLMNIIESKPHPKLWFDDGSLVIQASSIRYRIHRTIICQHSAIFRDMMAMPQPNDESLDNENTFDGCPVVKLEDNSDELSMLLEALYNLDYVQELELAIRSGNEDIALQSISGVLRLSTKYESWTLRKKAVRVLEMLNPTELKEFMARCSTSVARLTEDERAKQMARLFSIVELSKNCGLLQFLPVALYRIGRLLAPDGSQDNHLLINSSKIDSIYKIWCLSGRTRISQVDIVNMTPTVLPSCVKNHTEDTSFPSPKAKNGRTLFSRIEWESRQERCYQCILEARQIYFERQLCAWNLLPDYFGFPGKSWAELKQNDAEANN
ncbi:hypothetical protein BJ912DRAFT_975411 [Pholiota molesta]|nr:hypothetical protein BJ912DRAFT_975411 [Pholiota molesta]